MYFSPNLGVQQAKLAMIVLQPSKAMDILFVYRDGADEWVKSNKHKDFENENVNIYENIHLRRAPPGRLGSSFMRFPAMSDLFKDLRAASAALTS